MKIKMREQWFDKYPLMKACDDLFSEDEISLMAGRVNIILAKNIAQRHKVNLSDLIEYANLAMGNLCHD